VSVVPRSVRVSRVIRARADQLFRAWTDPQELRQWWHLDEDGWECAGAAVDLRVGGEYRLAMTDPGGRTHVAVGVYREIQPGVRLSFTWDWENPASRVGDTVVTVEFRDAGDDRTEVIVTHRFDDGTRIGMHERGWTDLLQVLERCTAGSRATPKEARR